MNKTTIAIIILILLIIASGTLLYMFLRNANSPITPIEPIPLQNMPLTNLNIQPNVNAQVPPATATPDYQTASVSIANFAFNPTTITVKIGTTVTWINDDPAPHTIISPTFTSNTLNTGDSFSYTFNQEGTFNYYCSIHPSMTGQIIVQ